MNPRAVVLTIVALVAGMLLPIQFGINAQLARRLGSSIAASALSFWVGTLLLTLITVLVVRDWPPASSMRQIPLYVLVAGGLLGATFLTTNIFLVPRLGSAATLCFVVAGQLIAALTIDQFGGLSLAVREISLGRAAGATLVLIGAVMVRLL